MLCVNLYFMGLFYEWNENGVDLNMLLLLVLYFHCWLSSQFPRVKNQNAFGQCCFCWELCTQKPDSIAALVYILLNPFKVFKRLPKVNSYICPISGPYVGAAFFSCSATSSHWDLLDISLPALQLEHLIASMLNFLMM